MSNSISAIELYSLLLPSNKVSLTTYKVYTITRGSTNYVGHKPTILVKLMLLFLVVKI